MKLAIELLKKDILGLRFDYDAVLVEGVRGLARRRWNPAHKRWEAHLSQLPEIIQIFSLAETDIPPAILGEYKSAWSGARLRVRLGSLQSSFAGAGITAEALMEIDDATSFPMPGHQFSPKFKAKQWDGRRHLFERQRMKFPSGLWPRIRAILEKHQIQFDIEDDASPSGTPTSTASTSSTSSHARSPDATPLRPYQTAALERALEKERGIIQIATGGGKTLLAAHLIRRLNRKTYFFVHTRELLYQAASVFEKELGRPIGRLGDGHAEIEDITVCTIQTAARVFGVTVPRAASAQGEEKDAEVRERPVPIKEKRTEIARSIQEAEAVIFDECHHVPADTFYKIAFRTPKARYRYGLSATPWRDDGHDLMLEAALGEKICAVSCSDLIGLNFLTPPQIVMEKAPVPRFNPRGLDYAAIYRLAIVENQPRNRVIAAQAQEWADSGLSVLILVSQVEHGERLLELLPEAAFAHGSLDTDLRRRYLDELERKLRKILIATTLADEGLDIPSLEGLILAGGGKSGTKAYQRIGRALRKEAGKETAKIMDFFDPVTYLADHSRARLDLYRHEPRFKVEIRGFHA